MKVSISTNNTKLGAIPNLSLIPVKDCANCSSCKDSCYALKAWKMYPQVRKAWKANSLAFRQDTAKAITEVSKWFQSKGHNLPRFFRIHVAGDFLSQDHVNFWMLLADTWQETKFLAFTKRHDLVYHQAPPNLQIVLSMFPMMPQPSGHNRGLPRAWLIKDAEGRCDTRVPVDSIECPGGCESCAMCWDLKNIGKDVSFHLH
jgi:hypothetical protein